MSSNNNATTVATATANKNKVGEQECKQSMSSPPLTPPDSPRTKSRKYELYITGGDYQGKHYYGEDYQGAAEYLQDQMNKKHALMTREELEAHMEEIADLDDDYVWSSFS